MYEPIEVIVTQAEFAELGNVTTVHAAGSNPPRRKQRRYDIVEPGESYADYEIKLGVFRPKGYDPDKAIKIRDSSDAARLMESFAIEPVESMAAILLDGKHSVLGVHIVARGHVTSVGVDPANMFRAALVVNAVAIIMVHNHPSGDPGFSGDDRKLTKRMRDAGDLLGIEVLDHIVVGVEGRFAAGATTTWWASRTY